MKDNMTKNCKAARDDRRQATALLLEVAGAQKPEIQNKPDTRKKTAPPARQQALVPVV